MLQISFGRDLFNRQRLWQAVAVTNSPELSLGELNLGKKRPQLKKPLKRHVIKGASWIHFHVNSY